MKSTFFLISLFPILLLPAAAQENGEAASLTNSSAQNETPAWVEDLSNLPEAERKKFVEHLRKAREFFQQKRIFETLEELRSAKDIYPDSPEVENLLGASHVEFRAFDEAKKHFERALELAPDNPSVLFNLAELQFVTKQWKEAASSLESVITLIDEQGSEDRLQLRRVVEFKLMLTQIKLGNMERARSMAEKYDFLDDSPYPYYAEAALAFHNDRPEEADAAIARARRIFQDTRSLAAWQDTLMEFGYIKSFFGGDIEEPLATGN